ncbi:hypothetical protein Tco_0072691 [Tanacetum coccineum]
MEGNFEGHPDPVHCARRWGDPHLLAVLVGGHAVGEFLVGVGDREPELVTLKKDLPCALIQWMNLRRNAGRILQVAHQKSAVQPGQWMIEEMHVIAYGCMLSFYGFQVIVLQLEFLMLKDNEAKVLNVSDAIEENNAFDATSSYLTELEANEVVNDGDMEFVGVNENNEGSKGILEDVPEVNKKAAHVIIENSENGVSSDADLDETVIHIRVNGDSVDHRTQPDGEISGEVNGDQLHEDVNGKDALVLMINDDDSQVVPKRFKPSSSAIHEPEVERQPSFDDKVSESVADSSEIREQKDEDKPLNKEPESIPDIC